jgi:hypothetical protein
MNRYELPSSFPALPASGGEPLSAADTERTVQIPLPLDASPRHITPGGVRRDWRLIRHVFSGILLLLLVIVFLERQPTTPRVTVWQTAPPQEPSRQPAAPVVVPAAPSFTPPSYYDPQPPTMFQSPQNAVSFPVTPPSGTAGVEMPVASRSDFDAARPSYARVGFAVPPAVPIAAQ